MNERLLRLVNARDLGGTPVPGARYVPASGPEEQRVRDLLLGNPPDRYSTLLLLQRLESHSDLARSLDSQVRTYRHWLDDYRLWTNVEGVLHGRILRQASEWPVQTRLTVTGPGPELTITLGDRQWTVTAVDEGGLWTADWPEETGLQGSVELDDLTDRLVVDHRPVSVDLSGLRARLQNSAEVRDLVLAQGLDTYFYRAVADTESVLAAVQALIQANGDIQYV
jgi:hypothetical protein